MSLRPIAAPQKHTDRPLATCVGSLRPAAHMACLEVPIENEPTMPEYNGAPTGYDATAYARDVAAFRTFAENAAPDMKIVGPAVVGEDGLLLATSGVDFGFNVGLEGSPEDFSVSIGTGS